DRRVSGAVLHLATPQHFAGVLIECRQRSLAATGRADQFVAVHERRFRIAPAGHHLAAEVFLHAQGPKLLAALAIHANERPLATAREKLGAVHGGGTAWTVAVAVLEALADLAGPNLLATFHVESEDEFGLVAGTDRVEPVADDRRSRVPNAGVLEGPQQARSL